MGRPRGKAKKLAEDASNDDGGSGGEEAATTDHKRSGSPLKPLRDDGADEEAEDIAKVPDSVKPVVPTKDADSTGGGKVPDGGMKRPRRRRRRLQVKRSSESVEDVADKDGDDVRTKSNGFRRNRKPPEELYSPASSRGGSSVSV